MDTPLLFGYMSGFPPVSLCEREGRRGRKDRREGGTGLSGCLVGWLGRCLVGWLAGWLLAELLWYVRPVRRPER